MKRSVRSETKDPRISAAPRPDVAGAEAAEYVPVLSLADLPIGTGTAIAVAGDVVALFNAGGVVYAIDDWDLDSGASLADGRLDGTIVASPNGRLSYDLTSGGVVGVPGLRVGVYGVRVVDGVIMIAVCRRQDG